MEGKASYLFHQPNTRVPENPYASIEYNKSDTSLPTALSTDQESDNAVHLEFTPHRQRWRTGLSPWNGGTVGRYDSPDPAPAMSRSTTGAGLTWSNSLRAPVPALHVQTHPPAEEAPPVALATPFLPGINQGIWAPPSWKPSERKEPDEKDTQIRALTEQVDRLLLEKDMALTDNIRLLGEVHQLSALVAEGTVTTPTPTVSIPSSRVHDGPSYVPSINQGHYQTIGLSVRNQNNHTATGAAGSVSAGESSAYRPSQMTVDLILSGKLDYLRMDPRSEYDLVHPLVWTIAHQEPKSNVQAATLKVAANALGARLGQPRSLPITQYLVSVILEWAKPLCFTSNGNYLCQQLLEKGTSEDKINFIKVIENDIVPIANNKFGAHVLVKAVGVKELESRISDALTKYGIFESMQTGARKVWRPYLGKCRSAGDTEIFDTIKAAMRGRWTDLAVSNENGSISVQQIFEGCANQDLIDSCFQEILDDISRLANNQFGHFVVNKLLNFHEPLIKGVSHAILTAYPPLATNHHGVQFVEYVLSNSRILQRSHIIKYLESLCSQKDGRTPAIVAVANSSVGRGHLQSVLRQVPPGERALMSRVHNTCRNFQTTLRNSQSGNELLRSLGIINTPVRRG